MACMRWETSELCRAPRAPCLSAVLHNGLVTTTHKTSACSQAGVRLGFASKEAILLQLCQWRRAKRGVPKLNVLPNRLDEFVHG